MKSSGVFEQNILLQRSREHFGVVSPNVDTARKMSPTVDNLPQKNYYEYY